MNIYILREGANFRTLSWLQESINRLQRLGGAA